MFRNLISRYMEKLKCIKNDKISKKIIILLVGLVIMSLFSVSFISRNEDSYDKSIAKIVSVTEEESKLETNSGKVEPIKNQNIQAIIVNGIYKGKIVELTNTGSFSQINDLDLKINIVIKLNNWSGIHFEDMEFLTNPPEKIFFIELIIGTLGGHLLEV